MCFDLWLCCTHIIAFCLQIRKHIIAYFINDFIDDVFKACKITNTLCIILLQERIRELYEKLSEKLDAGRTANHLYQQGALIKKEFEEIQQLSTDLPTRAAEQLLNIVLSQTDDFLDCFLNSLIRTEQLDVHQWIVLQGLFTLLWSTIEAYIGEVIEYSKHEHFIANRTCNTM